MSHFPPPGPPPPPYYGQPPHHPPGYAYVPAPVMMPMPVYQPPPPVEQPPPQSTYITNYVYQQPPPEPVHVVEDVVEWLPTNTTMARNYGGRSVVAGYEGWDGSPLWVIRARFRGGYIPGKLAAKHGSAFIPFAGKEVSVHEFEILVAQPNSVQWLPGSNGQVPAGAIPAGNTQNGEPLYVGRVHHLFSLTPGKVHPSHACCYISFGGSESSYRNYEVLCKVA